MNFTDELKYLADAIHFLRQETARNNSLELVERIHSLEICVLELVSKWAKSQD